MNKPSFNPFHERGVALVVAMLLLLVVSIMALSMFRSYGVSEKIAGNVREKQRALHAAETAEQYAEYWLSSGTNAAITPVQCTAMLNANLNQGQICSNVMTTAVASTTDTWLTSKGAVGVSYLPQNLPSSLLMNVTTAAAQGTYYQPPVFYISYLGAPTSGDGAVFKIDAAGFGAATNSVAVVESTYIVGSESSCLSC